MNGDDIEDIRARLAAREHRCWDRLDDAVSELCALHGVDEAEILARVRASIASEWPEPEERVAEG
jgi:hypothetical protein